MGLRYQSTARSCQLVPECEGTAAQGSRCHLLGVGSCFCSVTDLLDDQVPPLPLEDHRPRLQSASRPPKKGGHWQGQC